ncbi:MAG: RNA-binding protein [Rheinheimera sp.]|nr:RNA-binding protein [Rheinheimera sp.]
MLPSLRSSLPFTLALAIITYLVFSFVLSSLVLDTAVAVTVGVVLAGILVPVLVELKPLESADTASAPKTISVTASGPSVTLYVGNLPYKANEEAVRELFQQSGTVINVRLMKDRQTGRRRGFGFVEVAAKDANKVIQKLNDFEYEGRTLKVREAKERQDNDDSDE